MNARERLLSDLRSPRAWVIGAISAIVTLGVAHFLGAGPWISVGLLLFIVGPLVGGIVSASLEKDLDPETNPTPVE